MMNQQTVEVPEARSVFALYIISERDRLRWRERDIIRSKHNYVFRVVS